jgi:APA family basic amino acid/polyamine antiporter
MFPKAGGQYIYIKEAYGKLVGFYTVGVSLP